ncbi:MAG TPA: hypothetical protein VH500_08905 [Nitrososphaeraceae archaeon]|jgi:hypothetical protein
MANNNKDNKHSIEITFNDRKIIGYVSVTYYLSRREYRGRVESERVTRMAIGEDKCEVNTNHMIRGMIQNTEEFPELKDVTHIRFTTDGAFLSHDFLDAHGKCIHTHMIPICNLQDIVISNIDYDNLGIREKSIKDILIKKKEIPH